MVYVRDHKATIGTPIRRYGARMIDENMLIACVDLAGRTGATDVEVGHNGDTASVMDEVTWHAAAIYRGARIFTDGHPTPTVAVMALAERLLRSGTCRCGSPVTLSSAVPGCRWQLIGQRWEPACDAPPLRVRADPGDTGAIAQALAERVGATRRERRWRR